MAFSDRINESIRGRTLGFEFLSSAKHGTTKTGRMLVGPEVLRIGNTTAETTATNLAAYGQSVLNNSSAGSSQVFTLDPPIPGVQKTVVFNSTVNTQYLRASTDASITFITATQGTTKCIIASTNLSAAALTLVGITTAVWAAHGSISTGHFNFTTST